MATPADSVADVFEWTPELIETMLAMKAKGLTAGQIGMKLGTTRNAVIGKIHRERVKRGLEAKFKSDQNKVHYDAARRAGKSFSTRPARKPAEKAPQRQMPSLAPILHKSRQGFPRNLPRPANPLKTGGTAGATLLDRTGCCFPVNDGQPYRFCNADGEQRGHSVYCEHHWQRMHEKPLADRRSIPSQ